MSELDLNKPVSDFILEQDVGLFAKRETCQEAFDWALTIFPKEDHARLCTALMVYHNSLVNSLAKELKRYGL